MQATIKTNKGNIKIDLFADKAKMTVSNFVNLLGRPWRGNGAILAYHRVLPDEKIKEDLDVGLAVPASNFEKQIKLLKANYDIVSIDELINNLKLKNKRKIFALNNF